MGAFGKAIVIANPHSGRGWVRKNPTRLESLLDEAGVDAEVRLTTARGHATQLAAEAIDEGHRFIVACGGDGTIHEVINGLMADGKAPADVVLGVISAGSGSDFIKTFGLPEGAEDSVKHLIGENLFPFDVGRVTHTVGDDTASEYFMNVAEAGLGGEVARRSEKLPRFLGKVRYLIGFWLTLASSKATEGRILLDDKVYEGVVTNLVVANAQFFGGGMKIAPKAHPGDGKFDVLVQKGTKRDYIYGITKVFKGEHVPHPSIKQYMAARVEVETDVPLQVEADGEILGKTKAIFEILPDALRLKI